MHLIRDGICGKTALNSSICHMCKMHVNILWIILIRAEKRKIIVIVYNSILY